MVTEGNSPCVSNKESCLLYGKPLKNEFSYLGTNTSSAVNDDNIHLLRTTRIEQF